MRKIIILILMKIFMVLGILWSYPYQDIQHDPLATPTPALLRRHTPIPTPTPWGKPKCDPWFLPYPYDQNCQPYTFPRR